MWYNLPVQQVQNQLIIIKGEKNNEDNENDDEILLIDQLSDEVVLQDKIVNELTLKEAIESLSDIHESTKIRKKIIKKRLVFEKNRVET